ncbi:MAG: aldo/keto reductase [Hyphomicrobiaceae bacterium]|nr:aldo/keto reductase [Hyphomicrobiaceae bacterium]
MRTVTLKTGEKIPQLGLGTWHMGTRIWSRGAEAKAIRAALDLGIRLIDTAEMYGEGGAEKVIAEAIAGRRDGLYIVSKVYPHNASRSGVVAACERSLKRMRIDCIDLYLLHWRGQHPLAETVAGFEQLRAAGKIRDWGVSNFDVDDMVELRRVPNGKNVVSNQVLYHLGSRGIDYDLVADAAEHGDMIMAYSPLGQGSILGNTALGKVAAKHGVAPAAVAIAWTMRHPHVVSIPKAADLKHVEQNAAAERLVLDADDMAALDAAFPPPRRKSGLAMI